MLNQNYTYLGALNVLEAFCTAHLDIRRFSAGDEDQMSEITSKGEKFPMVYVTPIDNSYDWEMNTFSMRVYVYDRMAKDLSNVNAIRSSTNQIITDLDVWLRKSDDLPVEITTTSNANVFSNELMTDVTGWYMDINVDVVSYELCKIPFSTDPDVPGTTCPSSPISIDGVYKEDIPSGTPLNILTVDQDDNPVTPISGTIAGGVATVKVNVPIFIDATVTLNTSPFLTLPSGSTTDIKLINEGGSDAVPLSVVGSTITLEDKLYMIFNFKDLEDLFIVNITSLNVGTFTSQIATNIGVFSYSSDGTTFATVTYPFTPLIGTGWFRRNNYAGSGILTMIGL